MFTQSKSKKVSFSALLFLAVFLQVFGLFLMPLPAKAIPVEITADVPATTVEVKKTIGGILLSTAMGGLMNAFSYFMRKLAYDSAMWAASGGQGQGPLFFTDDPATYFKGLALDSVATMVEEIGKPFGLNLCQTPDIQFQIYLQIGLRGLYTDLEGGAGPTPSCSWQQLSDSWSADAFAQKYGSAEGMLERTFNNAVRVENTDFGLAYGAMAKLDRNIALKKAGANIERMEGQGFKAVTDILTPNKVKSPSQVVQEETMGVTNKGQTEMTATQVAGVYGSGLLQVFPQALSVFLNTFVSQGLKNVVANLAGAGGGGAGGEDASGAISFDAAAFVSNRQKAHKVFSELFTIKLNSAQNYSLLEEMALCPALDDPNVMVGLDNCVIDADFKTALDRARMGSPLTIEQALKENLLHGNWILVSPKRLSDNTSAGCAQGKYCYSNIQKLRRNRILPLGFEIAALLADPDQPELKWTLGQVVAGFDDCDYVKDANGKDVFDPSTGQLKVNTDIEGHPYCHLIDPDWVLKAPTSRCEAKGYGPTLADNQTGTRNQYCADLRTCLTEESGRGCDSDQYGYCTREKNVWRFSGGTCDEVYNTCSGYTDKAGALNYYLARTLNYGECSLESVGCSAYSTKQKDGLWKSTDASGGMYFNEKIKNDTCNSYVEGCSGFYLGEFKQGSYVNSYADENKIFIKKAPDYLSCYDINPATQVVDWPTTKPELAGMKRDQRCSEFSQVCLPSEVNCDSYAPQSGVGAVNLPAKIGSENFCDAGCVGYETFKQQATVFESEVFPLHFIASNAKQCSGQYKGCDEFTNIDSIAKGGEGLEYFFDLKYCERPTENNEAAYYSWEGSATEGYILKLHKLRPYTAAESSEIVSLSLQFNDLPIDVSKFAPAGSPAYNDFSKDFLQNRHASCNESGYNLLINGQPANTGNVSVADCVALYDKTGKIYYRTLVDVIEVSDACHPLRKAASGFWKDDGLDTPESCDLKKGKWENEECNRCLRGGAYDKEKDACVYWSTGAYGSCPANQSGCREYTGNKGNNIENILFFGFEPTGTDVNALNEAKEGWSPAQTSIVAESLQVGLHSLQVSGGFASYQFATGTLAHGSWYVLSFWGRGNNVPVNIEFRQDGKSVGKFNFDPAKNIETSVSFGYDWRKYELGPVQLTLQSNSRVFLSFAGGDVKSIYFIDNLQLTRLTDTNFLIKNSWKTVDGYDAPRVCDESPNDPYPGAALGCRAYTEESTGDTVYASGFESLCREQAVGCRAVFDTNNNAEEDIVLFNAWCAGNVDGKCKLAKMDEGEELILGECAVEQNASGCYVDKVPLPYGTEESLWKNWVTSSTVVILADTPSSDPVYMSVHKNYECTEKSLGCQAFGAETRISPTMTTATTVYLLNDPDKYTGPDKTLCRKDLVGCEVFSSGNDITFFKDPNLVGNTFCEYRPSSQSGGITFSGWYQKGTTSTPCYGDYLLAGGEYGLWSNGNAKYKGMVGICPEEANNCRELVDPMDKSVNEAGQPYYVIYDQRLLAGLDECGGQVSLKKGCALFNKTDQPNLLYDADVTYKKSQTAPEPYSLVAPLSTTENDANLILKVNRDRECGEWLACQGYLPVPDSTSPSNERYACYALQACKDGNNFYCEQEVDPKTYSGQLLNYEKYITRDISWFNGREYTGYSLFNQYPVADLEFVSVDKDKMSDDAKEDKLVLGYINKSLKDLCKTTKLELVTDGKKCGSGVCYNKKCVYAPNAKKPELKAADPKTVLTEFVGKLPTNSCRVYPEQNSPFTDTAPFGTIVDYWREGEPVGIEGKYVTAAICQKGDNCDCNYTKVGFGSSGLASRFRYYGLGSKSAELTKGGICDNGTKEGQACVVDADCGDATSGATCLRIQQKSTQIGWNGYCLEQDLSRRVNERKDNSPSAFACQTWYPIDYAPGLFDIYYNEPGRGYLPSTEGNVGKYYCAAASPANNMGGSKELITDFGSDSGFEFGIYTGVGNQYLSYEKGVSRTLDEFEDKARDMLLTMSVGKDGRFEFPSYEYISRIDAKPLCKDNKCSVNVLWGKTEKTFPDDMQFDYISRFLFHSWLMQETAYGQNGVWAEFFPVPNKSIVSAGVNQKGVQVLSDFYDTNKFDSGILWHPASVFEEYLSNKTAIAVSWIPLFVKNGETVYKENPAFMNLHQIFFNKEYPLADASSDNDKIEFFKSTMGGDSCPFCKWWVLKTDYKDQVGYLLQWWEDDPVKKWSEYISADSYRINPFDVLDIGDKPPLIVCEANADKGHPKINWLALEFLFDKGTGLFEGYKSRWCEATDEEHGIASAISWTMRPYCSELVQVFDDSLSGQETNKAYTDRVWEFGGYKDVSVSTESFDKTTDKKMPVFYDNKPAPFMSARVDVSTMVKDGRLLYFGDDDGESEMSGMAYSCLNLGGGFSAVCSLKPYTSIGVSINIPSPSEENEYLITESVLANGEAQIRKLFVKFFQKFGVDKTLKFVGDNKPDDKAQEKGSPPVIFPAIDCEGDACIDHTASLTKPGGFSVNYIAGKEANDQLFGVGSKQVTARFFTWAKHNQMPIRRIMIDWQEQSEADKLGTVAGDLMGYYSNYKPYCGPGGEVKECYPVENYWYEEWKKEDVVDAKLTGITCDSNIDCGIKPKLTVNVTCQSDSDCKKKLNLEDVVCNKTSVCEREQNYCVDVGLHFGNQAGTTCTNRPAVRFFNYTCDVSDTSAQFVYKVNEIDTTFGTTKWEELLNAKGYKDDDLVCVYQPRVQVMDNWGWCTGICNDEKKGGCYYKFGPSELDHCTPNYGDSWIRYLDVVVVAPSKN